MNKLAEQYPVSVKNHLVLQDDIDSIKQHCLNLLQQARREIFIYTPDFEHWLYDNDEVYELCKNFLLEHDRNRLHVLLLDSSKCVREGHVLLPLFERLASRCSLKKPHSYHDIPSASWLIIDKEAVMLRTRPEQPNAEVYYGSLLQNTRARESFEQLWLTAKPDVNLRKMKI